MTATPDSGAPATPTTPDSTDTPATVASGALTMSTHGAHVLSADSPFGPLLFLSSAATLDGSAPIRGGVPVIAPWFGTLTGQEPSHGWARRRDWALRPTADGIEATTVWRGISLTLTAQTYGSGFALALDAENKGPTARTVQLALHPYFAVSDVTAIRVEHPGGTTTFDGSLIDATHPHPFDPDTGNFDAPAARIIDPGMGRYLTVYGTGTDHTVVWNPGAQADQTIADLRPGQWRDFVCVEPARLGTSARGFTLAPGASATLGMLVQAHDIASLNRMRR
ncbi:aldose epimerase family protein [Corynebacterium uberis]|uniref:aldose epimerase family protein n=1 Tax=Corynebacterium TaxID=1716 RepID=UPI001D0B02FA|nr:MULTISPECIES: D-hexose-6-phosphate mutarotase [Corynebacterium]MCZ9308165.1 D-hexose-6-phosphate mutarotase [Corynebacterium sp. c6VSa_13]UDL73851.1 D-hexose-6-phosphate mutarotase [Corynebacterium uberis]UDL75264.1 D-hexose-6-phosphate mutarotase [Corynebacterium uberis]UDL77475.1 D-hexose-6-phosphate mutarotase [Corynebacterium uberis]UDL79761.1 D-hexose-6-phosphate mutarotase [Corynebacterium uberis]